MVLRIISMKLENILEKELCGSHLPGETPNYLPSHRAEIWQTVEIIPT